MKSLRLGLFLCAVGALAGAPRVHAQDATLYQDKTIKVVVGFTSGGFYDRWSRLLRATCLNISRQSGDDRPEYAGRRRPDRRQSRIQCGKV